LNYLLIYLLTYAADTCRGVQRFQKLYEAAEKEASVEKRQLALLHQQRVQAEMDDRKRRLLQKYVEAVDDDEQRIDVSCNSFHQMSAPVAELSTATFYAARDFARQIHRRRVGGYVVVY